MSIGYHYTTADNWKQMKRDGELRPYLLKKPEIVAMFGHNAKGIFLFPNQLVGIIHAGAVLFQMATKGATKAVLLSVRYQDCDLLKQSPNGEPLEITHNGNIEQLTYHDHVPILVLTKAVSVRNNVELIAEWDLESVFAIPESGYLKVSNGNA